MAGETANPIAAWPPVEHGGGRRRRGIVIGKNRARRAWTSQQGLQQTRACAADCAVVTGKARQIGRGNPLRHSIRNHFAISNWRN